MDARADLREERNGERAARRVDGVTDVYADETVTFEAHNVFEASNEHLVYNETMTFRPRSQIEADLAAAGFRVSGVWGGWQHEPLTSDSGLLAFEAARRSPDV